MTEVKTCENNVTEFLGIKHKKYATAWHKHGTWPRTKRDSCTRNWSLPEIRKANSSKALQSPSKPFKLQTTYSIVLLFLLFLLLFVIFYLLFPADFVATKRPYPELPSTKPPVLQATGTLFAAHRTEHARLCKLVPYCSQLKVRVRAKDPQTETHIPHGCARMMCIFVRSCY